MEKERNARISCWQVLWGEPPVTKSGIGLVAWGQLGIPVLVLGGGAVELGKLRLIFLRGRGPSEGAGGGKVERNGSVLCAGARYAEGSNESWEVESYESGEPSG